MEDMGTGEQRSKRARTGHLHSFSIRHAKRYGMVEALLLEHFKVLIEEKESRGVNKWDRRTWTRMPLSTLAATFGYLSQGTIHRAMDHLCGDEILLSEKFDQGKGDNTAWYAFSNEGRFLDLGDLVRFPEDKT